MAFLIEIEDIASRMRDAPLESYRMESVPRLGHARRSLLRLVTAGSLATLFAAAVLGIVAGVSPPAGEINSDDPSTTGPYGGLAPSFTTAEGRGVPVVTRVMLPLGQRNAADDF